MPRRDPHDHPSHPLVHRKLKVLRSIRYRCDHHWVVVLPDHSHCAVIQPDDPGTWYVTVGSGGVWKTVNAGTTWTPLFDEESVYSIGCVTLDPPNPHVVWVGTGEDVGGRHVSGGRRGLPEG
jgi:hypothetical protein